MNWRATLSTFACLLLITSLLPGALAQTNTLGISDNDVRDEPQMTAESNGFPHTGFSPGNDGDPGDALILESVYQVEAGTVEDVNNVLNRVVHGSDYGSYEYHIYPGQGWYSAYWGWWTDTGSGGSLQEDQVTYDDELGASGPELRVDGSPNGAIDDANDGDHDTWDEFVWRGDNDDAPSWGKCDDDGDGEVDAACKNEEMYVFMQPGTHNIHVNCVFINDGIVYAAVDGCALDNSSDDAQAPDFTMANGGQSWGAENGFARVHYDQSLLMNTRVTTSVDPVDSGATDQGVNLYEPESGDAWDIDTYSAVHPIVEDLYRTAVWDPGNVQPSPTDPVYDEGPKQFLKDEVSSSPDLSVLDTMLEPSESTAGNVKTQLSPIQKHEPTHVDDAYNGWANHDGSTCYGDCQDGADADTTADFYEPGAGQTYDGYQTEEHLFADGMTWWDGCPIYAGVTCYGGNYYALGGSAGAPEGSDNAGPYALYVKSNIGSWYDGNQDTWVGDASQGQAHVGFPGDVHLTLPGAYEADEDDPYASGMIEDPNAYGSDEFRGACTNSKAEATLVPQTPGQRWGTTGVYVMPQSGFTYIPMAEDATGGVYANLPSPLGEVSFNDTDEHGDGGQLSRYVTEGPITITGWCSSVGTGLGDWEPNELIVFPVGNVDYEIRMEFEVTIVNDHFSTQGANPSTNLLGETITDVDIIEPMVQDPSVP